MPPNFWFADGHGVIAQIIARQCDDCALIPLKAGPSFVLTRPYLSAIRVRPKNVNSRPNSFLPPRPSSDFATRVLSVSSVPSCKNPGASVFPTSLLELWWSYRRGLGSVTPLPTFRFAEQEKTEKAEPGRPNHSRQATRQGTAGATIQCCFPSVTFRYPPCKIPTRSIRLPFFPSSCHPPLRPSTFLNRRKQRERRRTALEGIDLIDCRVPAEPTTCMAFG